MEESASDHPVSITPPAVWGRSVGLLTDELQRDRGRVGLSSLQDLSF